METKNYKMNYYDLMKKIVNKEIDTENLRIGIISKTTGDEHYFYYDDEDGNFYIKHSMGTEFLLDGYDDLSLAKLEVIVYEDYNEENESQDLDYIRAKQQVIKELEKLYINLDQEINCCQGCMEGLDSAFKELNIYSDLLNQLSEQDNYIEVNQSRLIDEWYEARYKEEEEKEKTKIEALEPMSTGMSLMIKDDITSKKVKELINKMNLVTRYLQEKVDKSENI